MLRCSFTVARLVSRSFTPRQSSVRLSHQLSIKELKLTKYGEPADGTVKLFERNENVNLQSGQVLLKLIASSINPADINVIQGKYGHLPNASKVYSKTLPEVIGNEAVFEVMDVGGKSDQIVAGDNVLLDNVGQGTWCSHLIANENHLIKVPKTLPLEIKSTLLVNPSTAFLLLREFVSLKPGDSVLINAPTTQVGRSAIQIARVRGLKSICVVRSKTDDEKQIEHLKPDVVCTEEQLRIKNAWKDVGKPKLALNCVGGKTATDMLRVLAHGGTMVTFGGLSMQPLTVPTGSLIFRDQKFVGFWLSTWRLTHGTMQFAKVIDEVAKMASEGKLEKPACKTFKLDDFQNALEYSVSRQRTEKCLFVA
ncbi:hypothetical protein ACOME3_007039 [Neoechinorhynchus agilis]